MFTHKIIASPVGGLVLVANNGTLAGLYHEFHDPEPSPVILGSPFGPDPGALQTEPGQPDPTGVFTRVESQLTEYFAGEPVELEAPEIGVGTLFQRDVWRVVADIPYGHTRTYKDIAGELGNEAMGRAIGAAIRANPYSIVVPGHRVVSSGGRITGYSAGVAVKRALLDLEAAVLKASDRRAVRALSGEPV
ncbi:methylated-DNA--[protein]-cysteine S-methyltransferase [Arthrobacter sp. H5]|uniref:methylated-DNA--[protein]-cysteine S-methyltransferase n=1 Tax=Arthrobacter sp. H5 TaxID=1267973 RepID=UPI0004AE9EA9|nr:methylated-DNA--[protein]-cysteine S-methyltransferase [Arthrobacter sp. H5]